MLNYNILLFFVLILSLPYVFLKALLNKRFRYRLLDRIMPKPIKDSGYILVHVASLGEAKGFLNIKSIISNTFSANLVFSVTSNIGYDFLKSNGFDVFLAPLDFTFLYQKLFKYNFPKLAIFFETEIWPAYIVFLKKHNVKVILINARMSDNSYKFYSKFKLFSKTISKFDLVIARSKKDKEKFDKFNSNVCLCDNVKYILEKKIFDYDFLEILKKDNKKIFVFASIHEQVRFFAKSTQRCFEFRFQNSYCSKVYGRFSFI